LLRLIPNIHSATFYKLKRDTNLIISVYIIYLYTLK